MKVVHITPTYFDNSSIIGGGERYPTELASWMAKFVDTTLVSFSSVRKTDQLDNLKIEIYPVKHLIHGNKINPLNFQYLSSILNADVVHIHHIYTLVSDLGCLIAFLLGKLVFVTDYGGGGSLVLNQKLPIFKCYRNAIAYSRFGLDFIPPELQKKAVLIKGGIDTDKFCPDISLAKENKILYVGRILPHKGINYLIDAFRILNRPDYKLKIVGRVYNEEFYSYLKQLAEGLTVEFVHNADDNQLLHEYRTSQVTILPSVHTDCYGKYSPVPELMGFTLLESQACGTPAICTDAGAMHEFVDDGNSGFVVKQNSGEAIAAALRKLLELSKSDRSALQQYCCNWIKCLSWSTVVQKHLEVYQGIK
ncbi:glycosyltransferase family 4 protein [Halotia branconii]|uniref:Glycosyltransferase family 4 protein n=1 Tax=Halotia branconii CENA392 TaxID=1539056 RepID=A0AAJ6NPC3_9CYAN|nr:glycosyltransferase family 4 protein [Halotia branconii]WGV24081.1 glycosyltransferase family 4 protein [Halotia branconii CENA392]